MKLIKLGLLAGSILFTSLSYADMFAPSAYCTKPSKPYKFNNEWEVQQYLDSGFVAQRLEMQSAPN